MSSRNVEKITLPVQGMHCADCAAAIERQVRALPGVHKAQVLLSAERLEATVDPALVGERQIHLAVERAGYRVPDQEESTSEHFDPFSRLPRIIGAIFVSAVAVLVMIEFVGERLGLFDAILGEVPPWVAVSAVLIGGYPIFRNVIRALQARTVTAHALMTIGIIGALSIGEYTSAAVIVFFMRIADFMESYTSERSRDAIRTLLRLKPERARVLRDGLEEEVDADAVQPGDLLIVRPGERIPADGRVVAGQAAVDQAPITGESMPVEKGPNDEVFAGAIAQAGALRIEATRVGADTTLGRIITLVEEAEARKAPVQRFADRFTAYYIPVVLSISALTLAVSRNPTAAIAVLLVACACAIALATPMAVVASVGRAAREGILIKGGLYLEALARVDVILLDKTGTATVGRPVVTDVIPLNGLSADEVLAHAATAERLSEHPLAGAVLAAASERDLSTAAPDNFEVILGGGVRARWNGHQLTVGSLRLLQEQSVPVPEEVLIRSQRLEAEGKSVLYLAEDGALAGLVGVADTLRPGVTEALAELRELGVQRVVMLTGDNWRVGWAVADALGIEVRAELLPQDKIAVVQELQAAGYVVAMVGDGINDAPALAQADVGIAMGAAGTDAAIEAADVALLRDEWSAVPQAIRIGRRAFRTIKQNLGIGVAYNIVGIGLAALGFLPPVLAAAGQSIPDVAIMLNSSRLLRGRSGQ